MAPKAKKGDKGAAGGAHSHIRAQTNITTQYADNNDDDVEANENKASQPKSIIQANIPRQYITQMRSIAQKTQQRLSQETKRGFCKRCDLLLIPGETCTEEIQNESKGRRKPWADVLVIRCKACETVKRFPQNQKRSAKLAVRRKEAKATTAGTKVGVKGP